MPKALFAFLLAFLLALATLSWVQTWRLSVLQGEATKLRSTVQALESTLDRNSRATAAHRKLLLQAKAEAQASAVALEQALRASPAVEEWAATPVPPEVQNAP